jgi:hypothetical protein
MTATMKPASNDQNAVANNDLNVAKNVTNVTVDSQ